MHSYTYRVLYVSLHRYDNATFYPGRKEADHTHTGGGGAKGYNVNVAWNNESMGDAEYLSAFHHVILPIAYEVGCTTVSGCMCLCVNPLLTIRNS